MRGEHLLQRTIAGYRLQRVLGRGAVSVVFLAQHLEKPERVAAKLLLPSDSLSAREFANFRARFLREARAHQQLHHPHILPVLGYGEEDGLCYLLMPVIASGNLAQRIAMSDPLPLAVISSYLSQLGSAVDYAHEQGLVHRDIKPSNVLLDEQEQIYLADFGIVHLSDDGYCTLEQEPTTLTIPGHIPGTPAYMAPERFQGIPAKPATDIYSLGVLLYQLVTRRVPFEADTPVTVALKHVNEEPARPRTLRQDLTEPAEAAILKALAKIPAERFSTATTLATAFEAGLQGVWVKELQPLTPLESSTAKRAKQPAATDTSLAEHTGSAQNASVRARSDPSQELPSEAKNEQIALRSTSPSRKRPRTFSAFLLRFAFLLLAGSLALVVFDLGAFTSLVPAIRTHSTSPTTVPTRIGSTPSSSTSAPSKPGSTPQQGGATSTSAPTPTPTPATSLPPLPTLPLPTPTLPLP